jgi:hypothetical protein
MSFLTVLATTLMCFSFLVVFPAEARCKAGKSGHSCRQMKRPPVALPSQLSPKQMGMKESFRACMSAETREAVLHHVFGEFTFEVAAAADIGDPMWRGSPEHHGREVCLSRMLGLSQYRTAEEVMRDQGAELVKLESRRLTLPAHMFDHEEMFVRPWVVTYLEDLALRMSTQLSVDERSFSARLRVTSLLRTTTSQQAIVRRGMSPADCRYEFLCSTHTTGSAVDLGFRGVSWKERQVLFDLLVEDQVHRRIYFIIEGSHYHVFVLPPSS